MSKKEKPFKQVHSMAASLKKDLPSIQEKQDFEESPSSSVLLELYNE